MGNVDWRPRLRSGGPSGTWSNPVPEGREERSRVHAPLRDLVKTRPGGTRELSRGGHSTDLVVQTNRLAERGRKGVGEMFKK